jgi:hypothetical protein
MIERRYAEDVEASADAADGINRINDEEGMRWLYSFLSADRRKTYACTKPRPRTRSVGRQRGPEFPPMSSWRSPSGSCPTAPAPRSADTHASWCSAA